MAWCAGSACGVVEDEEVLTVYRGLVEQQIRVVLKVGRDRDRLVGAVGARGAVLDPFVCATLRTVLAHMPHQVKYRSATWW